MNELNYASLEASKKLAEAGIVLETDCIWVKWYSDNYPQGEWRLMYKALIQVEEFTEQYPAPCFTEVWRELPATIEIDGETYNLCCHKIGGVNCAEYVSDLPETVGSVYGVNMADNLIELLVWVKGAGK